MSNYKTRSDYFKMIAKNNKAIAHEQQIAVDSEELRKSFHRLNDEAEFNAASVSWAHLPCVVHMDHKPRYKAMGTGLPHRITKNQLRFLARLDKTNFPALSDAVEDCYDRALDVACDFMSYLIEDLEVNGTCGELFIFDFGGVTFEKVGPVNSNLYGWDVIFEDEKIARELKYDINKWFEAIEEDEH